MIEDLIVFYLALECLEDKEVLKLVMGSFEYNVFQDSRSGREYKSCWDVELLSNRKEDYPMFVICLGLGELSLNVTA